MGLIDNAKFILALGVVVLLFGLVNLFALNLVGQILMSISGFLLVSLAGYILSKNDYDRKR
jgi:uncharacterized membrane protein